MLLATYIMKSAVFKTFWTDSVQKEGEEKGDLWENQTISLPVWRSWFEFYWSDALLPYEDQMVRGTERTKEHANAVFDFFFYRSRVKEQFLRLVYEKQIILGAKLNLSWFEVPKLHLLLF